MFALPFSATWVTATFSASVLDSANCVGASTRLGADRQNDPLRMLRQGNHSLTPANNALPTRTIVAPSSTAIS